MIYVCKGYGYKDTVDERNPAPPGMYKTLLNNVRFTISTG